ncbi:MAG: UDP-N-acetylmuramoyl-tripeptide--D-alanyl-D-alanine ligase [Nocardioidaceae bacterium]|nr:UDP-N-acetylmuramoyl-tripeptide--D-alanyl-D-alanine ligase [Nocardioidaceae bacterium]
MIPMTLAEIATVVGGETTEPDVVVSAPAFLDSREPLPGGLFVAIAGEHVDGHEFAQAAVTGGAAAVLGSRATGVPTVVVADAQAALQALARHVLRRLRTIHPDLQVVALTGSQGKTSTKDLIAAVLQQAGPTVATYGSFNNELGLPLTVLRADPETRFLVLEMGARGIGHIAELCAIAPPDVALVLNVGTAHLGEFGSREAIAKAKGELVEALAPDGVAVLNLDDPLVAAMSPRTRAPVRTFGYGVGADVRLHDVGTDELGRVRFDLAHHKKRAHVRMRVLGEHQAINAAAAAAAALLLGLELDEIARALEAVPSLSKWRMELHERADGMVVVNDAYNANPDSTAAALRTLAGIGARTGRPTVAVLGVMRELGETSDAEHIRIGALAAELGIGRLVVVGEDARPIADGYPGAAFAASVDDAVADVRNNADGTAVVLVKASRAAGLERVAHALLDEESKEEGP